MKRRTVIGLTLGVLVALVGALLMVVLAAPGLLKTPVEQLVTHLTGRALVIDGAFEPRFGRRLHLVLGDVRFANAEWAEAPEMVRLEHAEVVVDLLTLFTAPVAIERLVVEGADVHLKRASDGTANWQFGGGDDGDGGIGIVVKLAEIREARFVYDPPLGERFVLEVDRFALTPAASGVVALSGDGRIGKRSFNIEGRMSPLDVLASGRDVRYDVRLALSTITLYARGDISDLSLFEGVNTRLSVSGPDAGLVAELLGEPGLLTGPFSLESRVTDAQPGIHVDVSGATGLGPLSIRGHVRSPLTADGVDLAFDLHGSNLALVGKILDEPLPDGAFKLAGAVSRDGRRLRVDGLQAEAGNARLTASAALDHFPGLAGGRVEAQLAGADLSQFGPVFEIDGLPAEAFRADFDVTRRNDADEVRLTAEVGPDKLVVTGALGRHPDYVETRLDVAVEGPQLGKIVSAFGGPGVATDPYRGTGVLEKTPTGWRIDRAELQVGLVKAHAEGDYREVEGRPGELEMLVSMQGPDLERFVSAFAPTNGFPQQPFSVDGRLRLAGEQVRLDDVTFKSGGGRVTLDGLIALSAGYVGSDVTFAADLPDLSHLLPATVQFAPAPGRFQARGRVARVGAHVVEVDGAEIRLGNAWLDLDGQLDESEGARLTARGGAGSLRQLGAWGNTTFPDVPLKLAATVEGSLSAMRLPTLSVQSGESNIEVSGSLVLEPSVEIDLSLKSGMLDLDALGGGRAPAEPPPADTAGYVLPDTPLPVQALAAADARLVAEFDRVRVFGSEVVDLSANVALKDGRLSVDPLFYSESASGEVQLQMVVQPVADGGHIDLHLDVRDAQPGFLVGEGQPIEGSPKISVDADLRGTGATVRDVVRSLEGRVLAQAGQGHISGAVGRRLMGDLFIQLVDLINPFRDGSREGELQCAVAAFEFGDGKALANPGLVLSAREVNVFSQGWIDLDTEAIKFEFRTTAKRGVGISASHIVNPFVRLGGTLAEPRLEANPKGALLGGGLAIATTGLSIVLNQAWHRFRDAKDPCSRMLEELERK